MWPWGHLFLQQTRTTSSEPRRSLSPRSGSSSKVSLRGLLAYPDLVKQTQVNSKKQFLESQDFQTAVTEAVIDNQGAHNTMADYFFSDGPGINGVVLPLAEAFYEAAVDETG